LLLLLLPRLSKKLLWPSPREKSVLCSAEEEEEEALLVGQRASREGSEEAARSAATKGDPTAGPGETSGYAEARGVRLSLGRCGGRLAAAGDMGFEGGKDLRRLRDGPRPTAPK